MPVEKPSRNKLGTDESTKRLPELLGLWGRLRRPMLKRAQCSCCRNWAVGPYRSRLPSFLGQAQIWMLVGIDDCMTMITMSFRMVMIMTQMTMMTMTMMT
eukprot:6086189-Karenia_brevis.AAC.1